MVHKKLSTLACFIYIWEIKLDAIYQIDSSNYTIGPMHRLTIHKNMLSYVCSEWDANERCYGKLMTCNELKTFVIAKSNHAYNRDVGGAPDVNYFGQWPPLEPSPRIPRQANQNLQKYIDFECQEWLLFELEGSRTFTNIQQISKSI